MRNGLYQACYIGWVDLKLIWRKPGMPIIFLLFAFAFTGSHSFAFSMVQAVSLIVDKTSSAEHDQVLLGLSTAIWSSVTLLMALGESNRAMSVLHEQDDAALLLTAPISIRTVLVARLFGSAFHSLIVVLLLCAPWIDAQVISQGPAYLLGYPVAVALVILVSSICGLITHTLIWLFGLKTARYLGVVVTVLLALPVVFAFLYLKEKVSGLHPSPGFLGNLPEEVLLVLAQSPLSLFASAAAGSISSLATVLLLTAAGGFLAVRWTERPFLRGVQKMMEGEVGVRSNGVPPAFSGNLFWLEVKKNYRMIFRTPMILATAASLSILPLAASIPLFVINPARGYAVFIIFFSGMLSGSLALTAGTVESCQDLLLMAPHERWIFKFGKMATGFGLPCLALLLSALGFFAFGKVLIGLALLLVGVPLSMISSQAGEVFSEPTIYGVKPKLSPFTLLPLLGIQFSSGIVSGVIIASVQHVVVFIPCLLMCYSILFVAWAFAQLKDPLF